MKLITLDFETYYDDDVGFRSQTTEEYVRDERFHVIGVAVKVGTEPAEWFTGTHEETKDWLSQFPWDKSMAVAHNAMFDMAILNWHFDIRPYVIADTLSMARAIHGTEAGNSLARLATRYKIGVKGSEVVNAKGYSRTAFPPDKLAKYGEYCINDVELTYTLFHHLIPDFNKIELKLIDQTIRMFTEPVLELDVAALGRHLVQVKNR